jgi:hypothetical protein
LRRPQTGAIAGAGRISAGAG